MRDADAACGARFPVETHGTGPGIIQTCALPSGHGGEHSAVIPGPHWDIEEHAERLPAYEVVGLPVILMREIPEMPKEWLPRYIDRVVRDVWRRATGFQDSGDVFAVPESRLTQLRDGVAAAGDSPPPGSTPDHRPNDASREKGLPMDEPMVSGSSPQDYALLGKSIQLELPYGAVQLLYDVLRHFPHDPDSWHSAAQCSCATALIMFDKGTVGS